MSYRNRKVKKCVFGCCTKGVSIHDFPNPNKFPEQFQCWVNIVGKPLINVPKDDIYRKKKICHIHFTESDWNRNNRLNALAVPSLHVPRKERETLHMFPHPKKQRKRFRAWLMNIGGDILGLDDAHIHNQRRVCHRHFEERYRCRYSRISNIAVPTLCLPGLSTHRFPNPRKFHDIYDVWVELVRERVETKLPYLSFGKLTVCDKHFEFKYRNRNKRLNALAVPTLHLPSPLPGSNIHNDHPYSKETPKKPTELPTLGQRSDNEEICPKIDLPEYPRVCRQINVPLHLPLDVPTPAKALSTDDDDVVVEKNYDYIDLPSPAMSATVDDDVEPPPLQPLNSTIQEEKPPEPVFSWEKKDVVPADDMDEYPIIGDNIELPQNPIDISLYHDDEPKIMPSESGQDKDAVYQCNECHKDIVGFRYTCVQCADWDLCGACEARAAHAAHYMLRVPSPRPYNEIQAVLAAIRQQLLSENLFLHEGTIDSIKLEPKDELDSENKQPALDPLDDWNSDVEDILSEGFASDGGSSPRRKRRRRFSESGNNQQTTPRKKPNIVQRDREARPMSERNKLPVGNPSSTINNPFRVQSHLTKTQICDNVKRAPPDEAKVPSPNIAEPRIFDDLPKTLPPDQKPTEICIGDKPGHSEGTSKKYPRINERPKISEVKDKVKSDVKSKFKRLVIRLPVGSSAVDLARALRTKASVRIEPLKMETIEPIAKK